MTICGECYKNTQKALALDHFFTQNTQRLPPAIQEWGEKNRNRIPLNLTSKGKAREHVPEVRQQQIDSQQQMTTMTVRGNVFVLEGVSKKTRAMNTVKNWLMPEKNSGTGTSSARFHKLPESLLRSIRRRSVRVKRTKSLMIHHDQKRKSGKRACCCGFFTALSLECKMDRVEEKVTRSISRYACSVIVCTHILPQKAFAAFGFHL